MSMPGLRKERKWGGVITEDQRIEKRKNKGRITIELASILSEAFGGLRVNKSTWMLQIVADASNPYERKGGEKKVPNTAEN